MTIKMNSSQRDAAIVLSQKWNNVLYYVITVPNDVLYNGNSPEKLFQKYTCKIQTGFVPQVFFVSLLYLKGFLKMFHW